MREDIKKRIEAVRQGEVPDGYRVENGYLIPDEWETVSLNSRFSRSTRKNRTGCENVLTISAQMGLVNQREFYDKDIASEDKSGYFLMKNGEFAYNKSYSTGYPYGAIKQLTKYDEGIVSPLYICFAPKADTDTAFYTQYFEGGRYNREIYRVAQEGARNHGLLNIAVEDFFTGTLVEPSTGEQQKIAEILATCDRVIELKQQLLEEKRRQKQWLMQKLLDPNSGVRIPGYAGKWETCKLGDIMNITSVKRIHQSDWTDKGVRFLRARDIVASFNGEEPEDYLFISQDKYEEYSTISGKVSVGDLLVTGVGSIGVPYLVRNTDPLYFKDGNVIWFQNQGKIDGDYFFHAFSGSAIQNYIRDSAGIGTVGTYTIESGKKTPILLPSKEEQKAIANIINNAGQEVVLCKEELEALQQKKKALMQLLLTGLVRVNA